MYRQTTLDKQTSQAKTVQTNDTRHTNITYRSQRKIILDQQISQLRFVQTILNKEIPHINIAQTNNIRQKNSR